MFKQTAIVVGAGIVGLATARALALKGYEVTVMERSEKAVGASVRNFGMVWPIGQPEGLLYQRAIRSKQIWKEVADKVGIWYDEVGSVHLAYHPDEWQVLQELANSFQQQGRPVQLMQKEKLVQTYTAINEEGLLGGLYSDTEMIVDPREAIAKIPGYLVQELGVKFIWNTTVTEIANRRLKAGAQFFEADIIFVCSGPDFETLYPTYYATAPLTKCKLQMMRFEPTTTGWRMGAALCGGLSLIHYPAFRVAPTLERLKKRYAKEMPSYLEQGIHVMVSQNGKGELTVGDSHEYGSGFDPFDRANINQHVLIYLQKFVHAKNWKLIESWHGIYAKLKDGATELIIQPEEGVYLVNGLGGNGMTLSFGLAEEIVANI